MGKITRRPVRVLNHTMWPLSLSASKDLNVTLVTLVGNWAPCVPLIPMSSPIRHEQHDGVGRRITYADVDWNNSDHLAWVAADLGAAAPPASGSATRWWLEAPMETVQQADHVAEQAGWERVRTLVQLRRSLPLDKPPSVKGLRTFDPDRDVDAWLAVNNEAFSWHPDQGHQNRDGLAISLAAPWVDLNGFFVVDATVGAGLDGFCWTKFHPVDTSSNTTDPPLGEIYVIATAASARGRGLGRALVEVGMDYQHNACGAEVAMLWTEADNDGALRLYQQLGYEIDHGNAAFAPQAQL